MVTGSVCAVQEITGVTPAVAASPGSGMAYSMFVATTSRLF